MSLDDRVRQIPTGQIHRRRGVHGQNSVRPPAGPARSAPRRYESDRGEGPGRPSRAESRPRPQAFCRRPGPRIETSRATGVWMRSTFGSASRRSQLRAASFTGRPALGADEPRPRTRAPGAKGNERATKTVAAVVAGAAQDQDRALLPAAGLDGERLHAAATAQPAFSISRTRRERAHRLRSGGRPLSSPRHRWGSTPSPRPHPGRQFVQNSGRREWRRQRGVAARHFGSAAGGAPAIGAASPAFAAARAAAARGALGGGGGSGGSR